MFGEEPFPAYFSADRHASGVAMFLMATINRCTCTEIRGGAAGATHTSASNTTGNVGVHFRLAQYNSSTAISSLIGGSKHHDAADRKIKLHF